MKKSYPKAGTPMLGAFLERSILQQNGQPLVGILSRISAEADACLRFKETKGPSIKDVRKI